MTQRGKAIEILRRIRQISGSRGMALMCRGESQWFEEVSSRIWRDHRAARISPIEEANLNFDEIEEKIADEVRKFTEMPDRLTKDVIDELEVAGGKTNQINFTYDVGVATWFACREPTDEDGRVIMVKKNAVTSRFANRDFAPRQMPVLVSDKEGKIPQDAIFAIERIPAVLKQELLAVLAKESGLWTETIFSGTNQTTMGYVRLQGDTSKITKEVISLMEQERRMMIGLREAVKHIAVNTIEGGAIKVPQRRKKTHNESNMVVAIRAMDGIQQSDLVGLTGNLWMDNGNLYSLRVNDKGSQVAARVGRAEMGSKGLVHLRVSGLRTDRTWEVTVGDITEIELISWDVQSRCKVSLEIY